MEENGSQKISVSVDIEVANLKKQVADLNQRLGTIGTSAQKEGAKIDKAFQGVTSSAKQMTESVTSGMKSMIAGMVGFTSAMKAGEMLTGMVESAKKFNSGMMEVATISKEVAGNMGEYKNQILDMTTQIPISAEEASKALYQITSAGYSGAEGMKVLEISARNAIGGVTETATSADAITTILNAYKMSADDAEKVSDLLFTTVKLGKTTMGELGASIAQVAPMASSFGVSIDSVLAGIASLTKQGTPTSVAITQIRASLVAMSKTLGATYFQTHTLQEGLVEMNKKFPDPNKLKEEAGTIEAVNAVLGMTGKNAKSASEDLAELQKSAGATADAFKLMKEETTNQTKLLANNIQKAFQPIAETLVEGTGKLAEAVNKMFESGEMKEYLDILVQLVEMFGAYKVAVSLASVTTGVYKDVRLALLAVEKANIEASIASGNAMVAMTLKEKIATIATNGLANAFKALNAILMRNPIALMAGAVAVAGVAMYNAVKDAKSLTKEFAEMDKQVEETATTINSQNKQIEESTKKSVAEQVSKLKKLNSVLHDNTKTQKERMSALQELKKIVPSYHGDLSKEGKLIKDNTDAIDKYIAKLREQARAQASQDALVENEKKILSLEMERDDAQTELTKTQKERKKQGVGSGKNKKLAETPMYGEAGVDAYLASVDKQEEKFDRAEAELSKRIETNQAQIDMLNRQNDKLAKEAGKLEKNSSANNTGSGGGSGSGSGDATSQNDALELKKKQQKLLEMQKEYAEQMKELNRTLANDTERANLEALKDSADKELELRKQTHKERLEEIEKERAELVKAQIASVKAIWEADPEHEAQKARKKTKSTAGREARDAQMFNEEDLLNGTGDFAEGGKYRQYYLDTQKIKTSAQTKANAQVNAENSLFEKDTQATLDSIRKLNNDYLKEFGTLMQKRNAIADDYNMQIEQATEESQKRMLTAQRDATLADFDFKNAQDFGSLFATDVNFFPKDKLESMKKQLSDMLKSTDLGAEQYKTIADQMDKINSALVNSEQGIAGLFQSQLPILQERKKLTQDVLFAEEQVNALQEQRKGLETQRNGSVFKIASRAGVSTDSVSVNNEKLQTMAKTDPVLKSLLDELQKADKALDDNTQSLKGATNKKDTAEDKLKLFSDNLTKQLQNVGQYINLVGQNVASLTGLADKLGVDANSGAGKTIAGLASGANDAMGAYADFMSGNYIGALTKGISAVENFGSALGLWSDGNMQAQQENIERLERSNKSLEGAINDLKEAMENASPAEAVELYNKQVELLKQQQQNSINIMEDEASKWEKGSHSIVAQLNDKSWFRDLASQAMKYGATGTTAQSVLGMTGEQWKNLRENDVNLYNALLQAFRDAENKHTGSGIDDMIDEFVDKYGTAFEDLEKELNATLLGIDFNSLLDSFTSTLADMESSTEDFADNMTKTLNNAILKALVNEKYKDRIKKLYDYMAEATKDGIQQNEADYIKQESDAIAQALLDEREKLKEQGLITDDDTASSAKTKGFNGMSQDTGNELNGRFTAMQIAMESQNVKLDTLVVDTQAVKANAVMQTTIMQENQNLLSACQMHLEDIAKNTSVLPDMNENIDRMRQKIDTL